MLCPRCGSIQIVRARSRVLDKIIRLFTGKNRFACAVAGAVGACGLRKIASIGAI